MNGYEWCIHAAAAYGVGRFFLGPKPISSGKKGPRATYPGARALGRLVGRLFRAGQGEVQAPAPKLPAAQPTPALAPVCEPPRVTPEAELKGEALMGRIAEMRMRADNDGVKRLLRAAISDGRLELDGDGRPKLPGSGKKRGGKAA